AVSANHDDQSLHRKMDLCQEQVMKKAISISAVALIMLFMYFASLRRPSDSVHAAEEQRAVFLIRFGMDGKADVDWSGAVVPAPSRMIGWQFDSGEEIK